MPTSDPATASTSVLALRRTLHALWRFGSNALVGWTMSPHGIEVLSAPKIRLFNLENPHRRTFAGDRLMGRDTFVRVAESLGAQPIELRLEQAVGDGADQIPIAAVERTFSAYCVTKTDQRAVGLVDIVGFSRFKPEQQASQLATLEFALNIAAETSRNNGIAIDLVRSTTGDGFYFWNAAKGLDADLNLFVTLVLFLVFHAALKRSVAIPSAVPNVRVGIGIGSHYTYHQPSSESENLSEFIVGDVTILLARLLSTARPNQIVIADFERVGDDTPEPMSVARFLEHVSAKLPFVANVRILGSKVDRVSFYLTGPRQADGSYANEKLRIVDKHGFEHFCFNAKVNFFPNGGEPYFCGLQHLELSERSDSSSAEATTA